MKLTKHTKIFQRKNYCCSVSLTPEGVNLFIELRNADPTLTAEEIMSIIIKGDIKNERDTQ